MRKEFGPPVAGLMGLGARIVLEGSSELDHGEHKCKA